MIENDNICLKNFVVPPYKQKLLYLLATSIQQEQVKQGRNI